MTDNLTASKVDIPPFALFSHAFAGRLREKDVIEFLGFLNSLSTYRFTGVYRFEPGWVVSLALFDRTNPATTLGSNVKMKESYCWLTGLGDTSYIIEDAQADLRLHNHAAIEEVRSYVAVLLKDTHGQPWGTLCHFDFVPRVAQPGTIETLDLYRPVIEEFFVRDTPSRWDPDAPSIARPVGVGT